MKHSTHHLYSGLKNKNLSEVYMAMSLRSFALSLVMVFVPIYLYNLGYKVPSIFSYYVFISLFYLIGDYIAGRLMAKFGGKIILALSLPLMVVNFALLFTLGSYHWPLWLLALSYAFPGNLFWIPYHNDFSKAKSTKNVGKEIGGIQILITILSALGPLVGGVVAQQFGMQYTIGLTIIILSAGIIPLLRTPKVASKKTFDFRSFSLKENWRNIIAYGGYGLEATASEMVWPLFIFLIVGTYKQVGFITTLALLVAIFATLFIGKITDRYEKRNVLKVGGVLNFLSGVGRIIVSGIGGAYFVSIFSSITQLFLHIPFLSEYYLLADDKNRTEYIVSMEMSVDFIRTVGLILLLVSAFAFSLKTVLIIGILMGAVGALLTTLMGSRRSQVVRQDAQEAKI